MTYEEKLNHIINAIVQARKASMSDDRVNLYISETNGLSKLGKSEVYDFIIKIQYQEGIIKIDDFYNHLLPLNQQPTNQPYIVLNIKPEFDIWFENFLMQQKSSLDNFDFINILRIYDVILDINEQIQLTNKTTVSIHLLPRIIRFNILFPVDSIEMRDRYCETRWDSLKYLKEKGIIDEFKYKISLHRWDSSITISLKLSNFDEFYKKIKDEYKRRNSNLDGKKNKTEKDNLEVVTNKIRPRLSYNEQKGELEIENQKVKLNKDSFRAKFLEILLKNDKNRHKEWSWDEIIELIENTQDIELTNSNKRKFYPACDGLSKHIALKTGINDLLIFNNSTVKINPNYL